MRVVYLHQYFRTHDQAGGHRSYEFGRRLVERGHQVHMVTADTDPQPGAPTWRTTTEAGMTVHRTPVPYHNTMTYRQRLAAFGTYARQAAHRAASLPQDVVVATSTPLTIAIPGAWTALRNRVPMVLEIRDLWPEAPIVMGSLRSPITRKAATALEAWAYRRATRIIALSPYMADGITARRPDAVVTVIPNGCDTDLFADAATAGKQLRASLPWLQDRPLVLYAGTLGRVNGVEYLVGMADLLRDIAPQIRMAIVGGGAEEAKVRAAAQRAGVLDVNLHMVGPVPKRVVAGWFGAADLCFSTVINQPALAGNSANKVFDAWAAGCGVAINHGGWIANLIETTGAGIVTAPDLSATGAMRVAGFLADPVAVATARTAATQLAHTTFSRDVLFDRFEQVLLSAVGWAVGPLP